MAAFAPHRGGFAAVSRSFQPARVAAAVAVGVTALLATACSAGQTAQTSRERSTVDGATADAGDIALRDIALAYPESGRYAAGESAPLQLKVVNTGTTPDSLISIRSDVAPAVELQPAPSGSATPTGATTPSATPTASGTPSGSAGATPTGTATGSTSGSASPSGSAGASATPTETASATLQQTPVPIPPGTLVAFDEDAATARLVGLTRELLPGEIVMITFTFAKAGSVSVPVPVATPLGEVEKPSPVLTTTAVP